MTTASVNIETARGALGLAEDLRVRLLTRGVNDLVSGAEYAGGEDSIALLARLDRACEKLRAALVGQGSDDLGALRALVEKVEGAAAGLPSPPSPDQMKDAPWRIREGSLAQAGRDLKSALHTYVDRLVRDASRSEAPTS